MSSVLVREAGPAPAPPAPPADPDLVIRQARARQRRRRRRAAAVVTAVLVIGGGVYLAVGGPGGPGPGPGRPAGRGPVNAAAFPARWATVPSPGFASQDNALNAVVGLSRRDAWAVGYHNRAGQWLTLTEHWDGRRWSIVTSPSPGKHKNDELLSAAALGRADVWAVGYFMRAGRLRALIERFGGTRWMVVRSPSPPGVDSRLAAVAGRSSRNLWAVGSAGRNPLIEHWDGRKWSIVPSPNAERWPGALEGVAVASGRDAWAVGASFGPSGSRPLVLHWDGRSWAVARAPQVPGDLHAVAAIAPGDAWAVGELDGSSGGTVALAERWDGTSWQITPGPNAPPDSAGSGELDAVAGASPNAVWAAGFTDHNGRFQTLIQRWDGSRWTITASPGIRAQNNLLYGLGTTRNLVWSVGKHYLYREQALVEVRRARC